MKIYLLKDATYTSSIDYANIVGIIEEHDLFCPNIEIDSEKDKLTCCFVDLDSDFETKFFDIDYDFDSNNEIEVKEKSIKIGGKNICYLPNINEDDMNEEIINHLKRYEY